MKEQYLQDLKEIREIMNRSSRFLSLSGLSGISAGIVALAGVYLANRMVFTNSEYLNYDKLVISDTSMKQLLALAGGMLLLAVGLGIYFTTRKTLRQKQKVWDHQAQRLVINLAIPLVAGGVVCLILLLKGFVGLMAPLTLLFYGFALVNASKYTVAEIRSLGLLQILLALLAMQWIGLSLLFWAIGFGLLHIVYGIILEMKYKS